MADYKVVSRVDERVHIFRHELPGKWKHYSRPRWEKNAFEREEDAREWLLAEVIAWIDAEGVDSLGPITEGELDWIKKGLAKGSGGKFSVEPDADPNRQVPEPQFQCVDCRKWYPLADRLKFSWSTFSANQGYCRTCFDHRVSGGNFYGKNSV